MTAALESGEQARQIGGKTVDGMCDHLDLMASFFKSFRSLKSSQAENPFLGVF